MNKRQRKKRARKVVAFLLQLPRRQPDATGSIVGTGEEVNVNLGYIPSKVFIKEAP